MSRADDLTVSVRPEGGGRVREQHVLLRNGGGQQLDITGYTIQFDTGQEYELGRLDETRPFELSPGGKLFVVTAAGSDRRDGSLQSYPAVHFRNPRFDESAITDGGTVTIVDAEERVVVEESY